MQDVLVGKMVEQGRSPNPNPGRDLIHPCASEPEFAEHVHRGAENLRAPILALTGTGGEFGRHLPTLPTSLSGFK